MLGSQRCLAVILVDQVDEKILRPLSASDTQYYGRLKSNSNHKSQKENVSPINWAVRNNAMQKKRANKACFLNVDVEFTSVKNQIPKGSKLFLSTAGFAICKESKSWPSTKEKGKPDNDESPDRYKSLLRRRMKWVNMYKAQTGQSRYAAKAAATPPLINCNVSFLSFTP
mmetsp:Transcript_5248/g.14750  ORF Transcript_5248/g.14750 Transcript_5248/m.14750 type:complete len:170 (+) Transcript_5248:294-803(+)